DDLEIAGEDHIVGTYRTRDNIANLKLRFRVRQVTSSYSSSILSPLGSRRDSKEAESDSESGSTENGNNTSQLLDEVVVGWQEKLFSAAEYRFYSGKKESDFDRDALRKKFFHLVQNKASDGKKSGSQKFPKHKIYTTSDGEIVPFYEDDAEEISERNNTATNYQPLTTDPNEVASDLTKVVADGLRRRRYLISGRPSRSAVADKSTVPTSNLIVEKPSREAQLRSRGFSDHSQLMLIRFDVTTGHGSSEVNKEGTYFDLCVIKYSSNGVLEIAPDFSRDKRPYRVEMDVKGEKLVYEYWIEHASTNMSYEDQIGEHQMLGNFYATQIQPLLKDVGDVFEIPPEKCFRLVLNGEIVSAENFEYDGLFIHYFVELPPGWSNTEESQLFGITHTSRTTPDPETNLDTAHFSHTFEIDLYFDINRFDVYKESLPNWPQIFVEVISVDSWSRVRTEGYGSMALPFMAGSYDLKIDTWRPVLPNLSNDLRRYFIGGTPELEDLAYAGVPGDLDGPILSRFGLRTVSTGRVRLRLNLIHQAKAFLNEKNRNPRISLFDRLGSASLFNSVQAVLEAFHQARSRFQKATEGYDVKTLRSKLDIDSK
ncbi:hypothetical protein TCAL_09722, partial [Tigriopus californicus]